MVPGAAPDHNHRIDGPDVQRFSYDIPTEMEVHYRGHVYTLAVEGDRYPSAERAQAIAEKFFSMMKRYAIDSSDSNLNARDLTEILDRGASLSLNEISYGKTSATGSPEIINLTENSDYQKEYNELMNLFKLASESQAASSSSAEPTLNSSVTISPAPEGPDPAPPGSDKTGLVPRAHANPGAPGLGLKASDIPQRLNGSGSSLPTIQEVDEDDKEEVLDEEVEAGHDPDVSKTGAGGSLADRDVAKSDQGKHKAATKIQALFRGGAFRSRSRGQGSKLGGWSRNRHVEKMAVISAAAYVQVQAAEIAARTQKSAAEQIKLNQLHDVNMAIERGINVLNTMLADFQASKDDDLDRIKNAYQSIEESISKSEKGKTNRQAEGLIAGFKAIKERIGGLKGEEGKKLCEELGIKPNSKREAGSDQQAVDEVRLKAALRPLGEQLQTEAASPHSPRAPARKAASEPSSPRESVSPIASPRSQSPASAPSSPRRETPKGRESLSPLASGKSSVSPRPSPRSGRDKTEGDKSPRDRSSRHPAIPKARSDEELDRLRAKGRERVDQNRQERTQARAQAADAKAAAAERRQAWLETKSDMIKGNVQSQLDNKRTVEESKRLQVDPEKQGVQNRQEDAEARAIAARAKAAGPKEAVAQRQSELEEHTKRHRSPGKKTVDNKFSDEQLDNQMKIRAQKSAERRRRDPTKPRFRPPGSSG